MLRCQGQTHLTETMSYCCHQVPLRGSVSGGLAAQESCRPRQTQFGWGAGVMSTVDTALREERRGDGGVE